MYVRKFDDGSANIEFYWRDLAKETQQELIDLVKGTENDDVFPGNYDYMPLFVFPYSD